MIKKELENLQAPTPYVRFYPGNIFYRYVRSKEAKTLNSTPDFLLKTKLMMFFQGKRITEIEKLSKKQNFKNKKIINDLLDELIENTIEIKDRLLIYKLNNNRTEIEQLQLIVNYCRNNLSKIKSLENNAIVSKINIIEPELNDLCDTGSVLFNKAVSSSEIKKYTMTIPKPGIYKLKILIKDNQLTDSIKDLISGIKINEATTQFQITGSSGNIIETNENFISEKVNFVELFFIKPLNSDPALVFEESITTGKDLKLPGVEYRKIDNTKYIVNIDEADGAFLLVFSENYHPWWKAVIKKGERNEPISKNKHIKVNGYANGWVVDEKGDYQIILEYQSQKIYLKLIYLTSFLLLSAFFYLIIFKRLKIYEK